MKIYRAPYLFTILTVTVLLSACKKESGIGGSSTIKGIVYYRSYDRHGKLIGETPAAGKKIYIAYGDHEMYDDDTDADTGGDFQFRYLRKGTYRIFSDARCDTCAAGRKEFSIIAEVNENHTVVQANRLTLLRTVEPDDGYATVKGKIFAEDYNASGMPVDQYYVPDERVYIVYENDSVYFDDMRTSYDGSYEFRNLIPGVYRVYTFSKCDKFDNTQTYSGCSVTVTVTDTVGSAFETVTMKDLQIIR